MSTGAKIASSGDTKPDAPAKMKDNSHMVGNITAMIMAGIAILGVIAQGVTATAEIIAMKQAMVDVKDSIKEVRGDIKELMRAKK